MPTYVWKEKNTNQIVEVFRSIKDSDIPPNKEEYDVDNPDWERLISGGQMVVRNWTGRKGEW